MGIEILIGVLVAVLAAVTTAAALIGVAGLCGFGPLTRCAQCNRLGVGARRSATCLQCRHERVLHPLAAWSHRRTGLHAARHT